jgi:hypothetical protein
MNLRSSLVTRGEVVWRPEEMMRKMAAVRGREGRKRKRSAVRMERR